MVTALVSQMNNSTSRWTTLTRLPLEAILGGGNSNWLKCVVYTAAERVWHRLEWDVKNFIKSMAQFVFRRSWARLLGR